MEISKNSPLNHAPNVWALLPLAVFLLSYLVVSVAAGDFYKMPITVAFLISSAVAIAMSKGGKLSNRIEQFCRGAANSNIMLMVLIFILAGAFAQTAKAMGAVDATVNLVLSILPGNLLAGGHNHRSNPHAGLQDERQIQGKCAYCPANRPTDRIDLCSYRYGNGQPSSGSRD